MLEWNIHDHLYLENIKSSRKKVVWVYYFIEKSEWISKMTPSEVLIDADSLQSSSLPWDSMGSQKIQGNHPLNNYHLFLFSLLAFIFTSLYTFPIYVCIFKLTCDHNTRNVVQYLLLTTHLQDSPRFSEQSHYLSLNSTCCLISFAYIWVSEEAHHLFCVLVAPLKDAICAYCGLAWVKRIELCGWAGWTGSSCWVFPTRLLTSSWHLPLKVFFLAYCPCCSFLSVHIRLAGPWVTSVDNGASILPLLSACCCCSPWAESMSFSSCFSCLLPPGLEHAYLPCHTHSSSHPTSAPDTFLQPLHTAWICAALSSTHLLSPPWLLSVRTVWHIYPFSL